MVGYSQVYECLVVGIHSKAINVASFLFVNANEVIVIDNTSWIFIHLYVVQVWK
jgi:hypothetical protein